MIVNGREYPLWSQFVEKKADFIGGVLEDHDMGLLATTEITDIELVPNGDDSAFFRVKGKDFDCGLDVRYGGITAGEKDWLTFSSAYCGIWRIKK